ncbi:MAG: tetratricopeptide repeat protein, partial [Candidatus Halalkalibacterium sp. M3_1C_030]
FLCQASPAYCQYPSVDISIAKIQQSGEDLTLDALLEQSDKNVFNDPEKAMEYALRALSLARTLNNKEGEVKSLFLLGELKIRQADIKMAKPSFEQGLKIALEHGNKFLTAQGLYHMSFVSESESNFTNAMDNMKQSLSLYKELGLKKNIANCYSSFGRIYQKLGSYELALQNLFQSLRINEELDSKTGIAVVKTNIGNVYLKTSEFDEARQFFLEALAIDEENNDRVGILISTLNVGVTDQKMGNYDNALHHFRNALKSARELNYRMDEAILLGNIGSTLRQQGNLEESLTYLFSSLELKKEIDRNPSHTLNDISETYLALDNPLSSVAYSQQAIEAALKNNDLDQLRSAYLNLSNAYERQGYFESAYFARLKYDSLKDSLFTLDKARQMNELGVLYETEKSEQEISLLTLEKETAEFRRNTYLASGLTLTFILILLYYGQRQKNKKNRQLLEKEQEVAEMKSNFFSNISHEFRTPLTLISGPIEMLKEGIENTKMRSQLDTMEKNAGRLLSLINQLLDLSKLESGKLELIPKQTDMLTLVKGVTMTFQSLAEMKHVELAVETELASLVFEADREKVETILINLINNAFAHTPNGGKVMVNLGLDKDQYDMPHCRITVKDTGQGISEEDLPRVFDRFYRGGTEDVQSQSGTGTGIGLALTKELAELHGGSISVTSSVKQGSEFVVNIPAANLNFSETNPDKLSLPDSAKSEKSKLVLKEHSKNDAESDLQLSSEPIVLVIEDNKDVTNYLKDILGDTYRIIETVDGEQGVEAAIEYIPDLIISDVMMPKMDGYRVAERLKQDEKTSHIPLILLTAKADQKDMMQGLKVHADEYLTKPFRPEELRIRIQNLIESRRHLRERHRREFMLRPGKVEVHSMDEAFLLRVRNVVDSHIDNEDFTVEQLGREVGMSRSQLHRKLTALIDQSATEFIRCYRLHRAKDMINQNSSTISEISFAVGFGSPSYFSKCFREEFGFSPSDLGEQLS